MRTRVFLFCGIILAVCVWLLLHRTPNQRKTKSPEAQALVTNQPATNEPVPSAKITARQNQTSSQPLSAMTEEAVHRGTPEGSNEINQRALAHWQAPIEFYGKVIDENSNPIVGATVSFHWVEEPTEKGNRNANTQSDSEGLFSLHGARGPSLSVSVSKESYYPRRGGAQYGIFANDDFLPDPLNPVIFLLFKKGKPEPLMRLAGAMMGPRQYRLDTKGTPTDISFYTGKRVSQIEGQFRVQYWMDVPQDTMQRQFDWRCQISVPGGGLQATAEEFPFTAPEQGYQESIQIESNTNAWTYMPEKSFYVHLADGKYGRVKFSLNCSGNPFFGVEALINPSGSRNLEYDKYLPGNIMVDQSAP
jgi:hypothetical protein